MLREMIQHSKKTDESLHALNLPLIPGQPIYHPQVEEELRKNPYFTEPNELKEISEQILEKTADILGCKKHSLFYINGSYRHALDIALINAVEKEDIVLLIGDSKWNRSLQKRLLFFCNGADIFPISNTLSKDSLEEALDNLATQIEEKPYKIVLIPHDLENHPLLLPVNEVAKVANAANSFVLLDAHATAGTIPFDQNNRFDVIIASSNWGLASAPGLGILAISEELTADIEAQQRDLPPTLDLDYWQSLTDTLNKGRIPESFEFAPNELRALNLSLELITKNRNQYQILQSQNAFILRMMLSIFGFDLLMPAKTALDSSTTSEEKNATPEKETKKTDTEKEHQKDKNDRKNGQSGDDEEISMYYAQLKQHLQELPLAATYTTFQIPEAMNAREFYEQLLNHHLIIRLYNEKERLFQIGHTGYLTNDHLFAILRAFYGAMLQLKIDLETTKHQHALEGILTSLL